MQLDARRRWFALMVLCLGVLMIVLDSTIVNVALPWIKEALGFTDACSSRASSRSRSRPCGAVCRHRKPNS